MAGWVYRMLRLSTVVGCSVAVFAAVTATSGASAPVRERGDGVVRVLEMNLCDSGPRPLLHRPVGGGGERSDPRRGSGRGHGERGLPGRRGRARGRADRQRWRNRRGPWRGRVGIPGGVGPAHRRRARVPQRAAVRHRAGRPAGAHAAGVRYRGRGLPDAGRRQRRGAGLGVPGSTRRGSHPLRSLDPGPSTPARTTRIRSVPHRPPSRSARRTWRAAARPSRAPSAPTCSPRRSRRSGPAPGRHP